MKQLLLGMRIALDRIDGVHALQHVGAAAAPACTLMHAPTSPELDAGRLDAAGRQVPPSIAQVSTPLARQHLLTTASAAALSHGRTRRRALPQTTCMAIITTNATRDE